MSSSAFDEVSRAREPPLGFRVGSGARPFVGGLAAAAVWLAVAVLTALWPDKAESDWAYTNQFAVAPGATAFALASATVISLRFAGWRRVQRFSPWMMALGLLLATWEAVTAKLGLLPLPFFPPPQTIVEVVIDDWAQLAAGIFASSRLLATGYCLGAAVGFVTGVAIGSNELFPPASAQKPGKTGVRSISCAARSR